MAKILRPDCTTYKKWHKGNVNLNSSFVTGVVELKNGNYGLKALESGRLTSTHLETIRDMIRSSTKKKGKLWFNVFPHRPITSKSNETRMGKGKGRVAYFTSLVRAGDVIVEILGVGRNPAENLLAIVSRKLPLRCCFVYRALIEED